MVNTVTEATTSFQAQSNEQAKEKTWEKHAQDTKRTETQGTANGGLDAQKVNSSAQTQSSESGTSNVGAGQGATQKRAQSSSRQRQPNQLQTTNGGIQTPTKTNSIEKPSSNSPSAQLQPQNATPQPSASQEQKKPTEVQPLAQIEINHSQNELKQSKRDDQKGIAVLANASPKKSSNNMISEKYINNVGKAEPDTTETADYTEDRGHSVDPKNNVVKNIGFDKLPELKKQADNIRHAKATLEAQGDVNNPVLKKIELFEQRISNFFESSKASSGASENSLAESDVKPENKKAKNSVESKGISQSPAGKVVPDLVKGWIGDGGVVSEVNRDTLQNLKDLESTLKVDMNGDLLSNALKTGDFKILNNASAELKSVERVIQLGDQVDHLSTAIREQKSQINIANATKEFEEKYSEFRDEFVKFENPYTLHNLLSSGEVKPFNVIDLQLEGVKSALEEKFSIEEKDGNVIPKEKRDAEIDKIIFGLKEKLLQEHEEKGSEYEFGLKDARDPYLAATYNRIFGKAAYAHSINKLKDQRKSAYNELFRRDFDKDQERISDLYDNSKKKFAELDPADKDYKSKVESLVKNFDTEYNSLTSQMSAPKLDDNASVEQKEKRKKLEKRYIEVSQKLDKMERAKKKFSDDGQKVRLVASAAALSSIANLTSIGGSDTQNILSAVSVGLSGVQVPLSYAIPKLIQGISGQSTPDIKSRLDKYLDLEMTKISNGDGNGKINIDLAPEKLKNIKSNITSALDDMNKNRSLDTLEDIQKRSLSKKFGDNLSTKLNGKKTNNIGSNVPFAATDGFNIALGIYSATQIGGNVQRQITNGLNIVGDTLYFASDILYMANKASVADKLVTTGAGIGVLTSGINLIWGAVTDPKEWGNHVNNAVNLVLSSTGVGLMLAGAAVWPVAVAAAVMPDFQAIKLAEDTRRERNDLREQGRNTEAGYIGNQYNRYVNKAIPIWGWFSDIYFMNKAKKEVIPSTEADQALVEQIKAEMHPELVERHVDFAGQIVEKISEFPTNFTGGVSKNDSTVIVQGLPQQNVTIKSYAQHQGQAVVQQFTTIPSQSRIQIDPASIGANEFALGEPTTVSKVGLGKNKNAEVLISNDKSGSSGTVVSNFITPSDVYGRNYIFPNVDNYSGRGQVALNNLTSQKEGSRLFKHQYKFKDQKKEYAHVIARDVKIYNELMEPFRDYIDERRGPIMKNTYESALKLRGSNPNPSYTYVGGSGVNSMPTHIEEASSDYPGGDFVERTYRQFSDRGFRADYKRPLTADGFDREREETQLSETMTAVKYFPTLFYKNLSNRLKQHWDRAGYYNRSESPTVGVLDKKTYGVMVNAAARDAETEMKRLMLSKVKHAKTDGLGYGPTEFPLEVTELRQILSNTTVIETKVPKNNIFNVNKPYYHSLSDPDQGTVVAYPDVDTFILNMGNRFEKGKRDEVYIQGLSKNRLRDLLEIGVPQLQHVEYLQLEDGRFANENGLFREVFK